MRVYNEVNLMTTKNWPGWMNLLCSKGFGKAVLFSPTTLAVSQDSSCLKCTTNTQRCKLQENTKVRIICIFERCSLNWHNSSKVITSKWQIIQAVAYQQHFVMSKLVNTLKCFLMLAWPLYDLQM